MSSVAAKNSSTFTISLDGSTARAVSAGLPVLAGDGVETLFADARFLGQRGSLALFEAPPWSLGIASITTSPASLESDTRRVYSDIFEATRHLHLARVWNYVPAINAIGAGGLENYRTFCRGRSLAFEGHHGSRFKANLPSASAVGTSSNALTVVFAASSLSPKHLENPLQVPAYEYPEDYGPRSPSFARATVVPTANASTVFISGTAAIRGHTTMAAGNTLEQLAYTLENLQAISVASGFGEDLGSNGRARKRSFKVYLRHRDDQPSVAQVLTEQLFRPGDIVSYLHADICREALLVEIEATLM